MASVSHIIKDVDNIFREIKSRLASAEEHAVEYFVHVRCIQRIFRGFVTRKHIEKLHEAAICIQKNWRAFQAREIYRIRLKEKFDEMCWTHYVAMATMIQKCWRGYRIRSNVFSYYGLKSWLAFIAEQNKLLKCSAEIYNNKKNVAEMKQREEEAKEWIVYILFKLHHLLRTRQLTGIYSLPNTTELSEIEKMLKCLKYKDFMVFYNSYMEDVRQAKAKELPPYILQQCKYPGHFEREYYDHKKPHKDFLISRELYKTPFTTGDMEIREQSRLPAQEEQQPDVKDIKICYECACKMKEINDCQNRKKDSDGRFLKVILKRYTMKFKK